MNKPAFDISYRDLHRAIIDEIRSAAAKIKDFEAGATAVMYVPIRESAYNWLGIDYDPCDTNNYILRLHSIVPGGSMIRQAGWRNDSSRESVDCGGFVVQKVTACLRAMRTRAEFSSDALPEVFTAEGQYNGPGAMGFAIVPMDIQEGNYAPWLYVIVAVSGATGTEDKWCANKAYEILYKHMTDDYDILHERSYTPNLAFANGEILLK